MNGWNKPASLLSSEELSAVSAYNKADEVAYISEASVGELIYGIERSRRKEYNRKTFEKFLQAVPPVAVDRTVWELYGQTKAVLSKQGKVMPDMDLLIAATAKRYGLVLVANDKHMKCLPGSFTWKNWVK
jgi:tRNA(fMet)-specific endonuclease VapC